ncbi:hypothetical protein, partial [Staphylococcus aureus]|uniref:hypothetical protein n=1 Tax=Staphylococcus aureus TaxID=1280 RepID=UPI001C92BBF5
GIGGAELLLCIVCKLMWLWIKLWIHLEGMGVVLTILMVIIGYVVILFESGLFVKRGSML